MDLAILMVGGFFSLVTFVIVLVIVKKAKRDDRFKEFVPVQFSDIVSREMKNKIDTIGSRVKKGKLIIGFHEINHVDRYHEFKGESPILKYNENTRKLTIGTEKYKYCFMVFKVKNKSIIFRLLNLKNQYFLINKDEEKKILFFPEKNIWRIPKHIDFSIYGNVWVDDIKGLDYISDLGISVMNQSIMTHLINYPDRVVALDTDQTKTINLNRILTELEKAKYDKQKSADDTKVIS